VVQRLPEGTEGDGLVIRRWRINDAAVLHEAITANVEHLRPRMAWIAQEPLALDDRRDMIDRWDGEWADGGDAVYGVWEHDVVVAGCGLHRRIGSGGVEIGYWTHVDHQGRGVATTLSRLLTDLAFTLPEIDRVEINHDLTNVASGRIPEKLGYRRIGAQQATRELAPADTGTDVVWRVTRTGWCG
jgi:ribosomal-protein-serine acetyltransferase